MKKIVLTILSLGIGFTYAQTIITSADAPVIGDIDYQSTDDFPSITVDISTGGGKVWDFSELEPDFQSTVYYISPSGTPGDTSFPSANIVAFADSVYSYLEKGVSEARALGNYNPATGPIPAFTIKLNPTQLVMKYPSAYLTSYKDTSGFKTQFYFGQNFQGQQIDSVRITNRTYRDVIFDAYGDLTTPEGVYPNTLKSRTLSESYDTIEVYISLGGFGFWAPAQEGKTTNMIHTWYSNSLHFAVATVTMDSAQTMVESAAFYFTGPVANDDMDTTNVNTARIVNVGWNDFLVGPGTTTVIMSPANGSATVLNKDSITYTPDPGFTGTDYFVYTLCKTGSSDCDTAVVMVEVVGPNNIRTKAKPADIRVYPNPVSGTLFVETGSSGNVSQILITDITGRKVDMIRVSGTQKAQVDVSGYNEGIYLIQILGERGEVIKTGKISVIK